MPCIITGCRLVQSDANRSVWGDLHTFGDNYVFTANTDDNGPAWSYDNTHFNSDERKLVLNEDAPFWEQRGVIIVYKNEANFNEAARNYLGNR